MEKRACLNVRYEEKITKALHAVRRFLSGKARRLSAHTSETPGRGPVSNKNMRQGPTQHIFKLSFVERYTYEHIYWRHSKSCYMSVYPLPTMLFSLDSPETNFYTIKSHVPNPTLFPLSTPLFFDPLHDNLPDALPACLSIQNTLLFLLQALELLRKHSFE
jgi:hypothetical protein